MRPLFVLAHGLHGRGCDLDFLASRVRGRFPTALCLQSGSNELLDSNDGLLVCGERLAQEVCAFLATPDVPDEPLLLVAIGHSLGGLILRAALPLLLQASPIALQPCCYLSLLSPHLGVRRAAAGLLGELRQHLTHGLVPLIAGQTGSELLLEDDAQVLRQLAAPDQPFMQSLQRFRHCTLVAMPHQDFVVPFCTASLMDVNLHAEPTGDDPPFYVASHAGFPTSYSSLLDRHAPPLVEADQEDRFCSLLSGTSSRRNKLHGSPPSAGHSTVNDLEVAGMGASSHLFALNAGLAVDAEGELEFDRLTLQYMRTSLPRLRHLNVQFSPLWHPVNYHMAAIHQGLGKIDAGKECVDLLLDIVARDLSVVECHAPCPWTIVASTFPAEFTASGQRTATLM